MNADGMATLEQVVRTFDEHLKLSLSPDEPHTLRIYLGAAGGGAPTRIRIGGNVQQAKMLVKVPPVYPPDAKAQGIQGVVRLQAILGKDGKVEHLELTSGDALLAAAAMEAVRQWQYQPTLLNGNAVEVATEIDVNFTLTP